MPINAAMNSAVATMYQRNAFARNTPTQFSIALRGISNNLSANGAPPATSMFRKESYDSGQGEPYGLHSSASSDAGDDARSIMDAADSDGGGANRDTYARRIERNDTWLGGAALDSRGTAHIQNANEHTLFAPLQQMQQVIRAAAAPFRDATDTRLGTSYFFNSEQVDISGNARHAYTRMTLQALGFASGVIDDLLSNEGQMGAERVIDACRLLALPAAQTHDVAGAALREAVTQYVSKANGGYGGGRLSFGADSAKQYSTLEKSVDALARAVGPGAIKDEMIQHLTPAIMKILCEKNPGTCASRILDDPAMFVNSQALKSYFTILKGYEGNPMELLHHIEKLPNLLRGEAPNKPDNRHRTPPSHPQPPAWPHNPQPPTGYPPAYPAYPAPPVIVYNNAYQNANPTINLPPNAAGQQPYPAYQAPPVNVYNNANHKANHSINLPPHVRGQQQDVVTRQPVPPSTDQQHKGPSRVVIGPHRDDRDVISWNRKPALSRTSSEQDVEVHDQRTLQNQFQQNADIESDEQKVTTAPPPPPPAPALFSWLGVKNQGMLRIREPGGGPNWTMHSEHRDNIAPTMAGVRSTTMTSEIHEGTALRRGRLGPLMKVEQYVPSRHSGRNHRGDDAVVLDGNGRLVDKPRPLVSWNEQVSNTPGTIV